MDAFVKGLSAVKGPVLGAVAVMASLPVAAAGTVVVALGGLGTPVPSALAVADIPAPLLGAYVASAAAVLTNPAVALSAPARADLESGLVDPRLVSVLAIAGRQYPLAVSVIRTGHSQCVGGGSRAERPTCAISNHFYGRGVDVATVAGRPVTTANAAARALVEAVLRLPADLRPDEVGVPWAALDPLPGVFTDADHQDHIHLGWNATRPAR